MKAFLNLTLAGLKAFVRDRSGLFWSFFFPLFFIFIFGSLFSARDAGTGMKLPIGVVALDPSPAAARAGDGLKTIPFLEIHRGGLESEKAALLAGKRRAVVVFPAGLSENLAQSRASDVTIYYDPTNPTASIATGAIHRVIDETDRRIAARPTLLRATEEPLLPKGLKKPRSIDFLIPGILAMTIMQLGLFTAIPIINMREKGILKRFGATPLPRATLVWSQIAQRWIIAFTQTSVLLLVSAGFYQFRVAGSWLATMGLVTIGVLMFIAIGAVLASYAKTQESGMSLVQLVNMPMLFLSGVFFPVEFVPSYVRPVVKALPLTYLADALRHIMLASPSSFSMQLDVAVVIGWLVASLFVASRIFKWE